MSEIEVRPAEKQDTPAILALARELAADGSTYVFAADASDEELIAFWWPRSGATFVAQIGGEVLGCSMIEPNQPGRGSHVAHAAYAVAARSWGRGVGEALARHSLAEAQARGYQAMQFNMVVVTNARAIALWKRLGFAIVGTLPKVFDHPHLGLVDAHVMHRFL